MKSDCVVCGSSLKYLNNDVLMECVLCKKSMKSKVCCVNGHFVCDDCHRKGLDVVIDICLNHASSCPIEILDDLMHEDFCHMHGPEHHSLVGVALLTAYSNAGGDIDLKKSLLEMFNRSKEVPGGSCGYWGACGAAISAGIFVSIITGSDPLSVEGWSLSNRMTSISLDSIASHGGPRCCKRDSYLAVVCAISFVYDIFNIKLDKKEIVCNYSYLNKQCLNNKCPFYGGNK